MVLRQKVRPLWAYLVSKFKIFTKIDVLRTRDNYDSKVVIIGSNNKTIHFIHRCNTNNTGDIECGYYRCCYDFFKNYRCIVHDISSINIDIIHSSDFVIIGGGGLLNALSQWNYGINEVLTKTHNVIIWSAGFNSNTSSTFSVHIKWNDIKLLSVRDFNFSPDFRYVPCATCMLPYFDIKYEIKREIGIVLHHRKRNIPIELVSYPLIENTVSASEFIEFLGQSEYVVTNSYHAIYWATLLGKKCIVFDQNASAKFSYYKYPPTIYNGNLNESIQKAIKYDGVLEDCRTLTKEYISEILDLINI